MRSRMRQRSIFGVARRSLVTDYLKTSPYFPMGLQVLEQLFVSQRRLLRAFLKGAKILSVLTKDHLDRLIHNIRPASLCLRSLDPKRPMKPGFQVDG